SAAGSGSWLGRNHYRRTFWRLDAEGLALRRGRMWQRETRVPITRIQHLDLKRGPLQRRRHLATLTVHTAGTRNNAVVVPNIDLDDAEHLRDRLGRQLDLDDEDGRHRPGAGRTAAASDVVAVRAAGPAEAVHRAAD